LIADIAGRFGAGDRASKKTVRLPPVFRNKIHAALGNRQQELALIIPCE